MIADAGKEQTRGRFAGNNGGPPIAAGQRESAQAQVEASSELAALAVAFEAVRPQDRADVLLEGERGIASRHGARAGGKEQEQDGEKAGGHCRRPSAEEGGRGGGGSM